MKKLCLAFLWRSDVSKRASEKAVAPAKKTAENFIKVIGLQKNVLLPRQAKIIQMFPAGATAKV